MAFMRPLLRMPWRHYGAPCHEQPGKQQWHLFCVLTHPIRFARSRGPVRWRLG